MNIYLLGATGSIGTQTLDVIREYPNLFCLRACSLGHIMEKNIQIIDEFMPKAVCTRTLEDARFLQERYPEVSIFYGDKGLVKIATYDKDKKGIMLNALIGSLGLIPTVEAIKIGRDIAIANKETLVTAGEIVTSLAKQYGVRLLPVDSEHSAISQCLNGENYREIKRLIITASGGAFRDKKRSELATVTKADALAHPNWNMGAKITIDSATMMNKGFEVIEAHWLFNVPYEQIDTIMHRESVIHSMVEFQDSSIMAQLGTPDMRIPIIHALGNPMRLKYQSPLDLLKVKEMHFEELSMDRFPCLKMAIEAGKKGGIYPTVLNAANEAAVKLFLEDKITFLEIEEIIKEELDKSWQMDNPSLEDIIGVDLAVKENLLRKYGGLK